MIWGEGTCGWLLLLLRAVPTAGALSTPGSLLFFAAGSALRRREISCRNSSEFITSVCFLCRKVSFERFQKVAYYRMRFTDPTSLFFFACGFALYRRYV